MSPRARLLSESANSHAFFALARRCGECGFSEGVTGAYVLPPIVM